MRTSALVPPTRLVLKQRAAIAANRSVLFPQSHKPCCPSRDRSSVQGPKTNRRALSSSKQWSKELEQAHPAGATTLSDSGPPEGPEPSDDPGEESNVVVLEVEKVKRARRSTPKAEDVTPLPPGLNILWTPDYEPDASNYTSAACLPAPELFEDVLSNFLITMQPQTQHRAAYATSSGSPVEPTLALHCPIEGGDYIIDETVRELARRTESEVVTLDAARLAAGEWGAFGKGKYFHKFLSIPEFAN